MKFNNYCIIILGQTEGSRLEISQVCEEIIGFIEQPGIVITTFTSVATINELKSFFTLCDRNFLIYTQDSETNGYNITNKTLEETLFRHLNEEDIKNLDTKTSKLNELITPDTIPSGKTLSYEKIPEITIKLTEKVIESRNKYLIPDDMVKDDIKLKIDSLLDRYKDLDDNEKDYLTRLTIKVSNM